MERAIGLGLVLGILVGTASKATAAPPVGILASVVTAQADFGTIRGRLVWGGAEAPKPKNKVEKGKAQKNPEVCARDEAIPDESLVVDPRTGGVRNGFVYLPKPTGQNPEALKALVARTARVEVDQKNCRFVPHVLALTKDQAVLFKSSDPVGHNIRYAPLRNGSLNQMLAPNGQLESRFVVPERLPFELKCDIHPWMAGYIMVFDHPFFGITGEDGSFEIRGVPPGPQKLVVWQERVGYVTEGKGVGMPVEVKAGATTDLGDLRLDPAAVGPR